ncbi:hypothetical protein SAMN03159391_05969 [Pseudomonas sp. NFACC37-1]|nr:hypothetical protein SAMN03159391_05969 [Pseudomonas sp. NFACC37-1]SFO18043.1 hypothetical protein SAMN03159304_02271 [Pseudomonas sp. NFACC24-1]
MRRFKQLLAGRQVTLPLPIEAGKNGFEIPLKRWFGVASHLPCRLSRQRHDTMNAPSPLVRLAPITANLVQRNPKILLGGTHQPTLLRYLDGWPRRNHGPAAFLIQFVEDGESLARFANDSFDLAVIQSPSAADAPEMIRQLTRVARQGLITRR